MLKYKGQFILYYFSYGSNMSSKRLGLRVSASFVCTASLKGHGLRYHKVSKDGSGKCDIFETGKEQDIVHGVVFTIDDAQKVDLDRYEGLGYGYEEKTVTLVRRDNGQPLLAITYYATIINPALKPFDWYREHVLIGAREFGLSEDYVRTFLDVECEVDDDVPRREKELSIYK